MAESFSRNAMWAATTVSGPLPNVFESWTRALRPPMLVCTIMRTVWLWKLVIGGGACGALAGASWAAPCAAGGAAGKAAPCGEAAQVATQ